MIKLLEREPESLKIQTGGEGAGGIPPLTAIGSGPEGEGSDDSKFTDEQLHDILMQTMGNRSLALPELPKILDTL